MTYGRSPAAATKAPLSRKLSKEGKRETSSDLPASTCGLGNTYCREQTRRLHHIQPPNTLRITSQAMSAAVSFWHSLSNGRRSSSAMVMM